MVKSAQKLKCVFGFHLWIEELSNTIRFGMPPVQRVCSCCNIIQHRIYTLNIQTGQFDTSWSVTR